MSKSASKVEPAKKVKAVPEEEKISKKSGRKSVSEDKAPVKSVEKSGKKKENAQEMIKTEKNLQKSNSAKNT